MSEKLAIIGADYMQINKLAKRIHKMLSTAHEHTDLRDTKRGRYFDVRLERNRVARVTIELDRVETDEERAR